MYSVLRRGRQRLRLWRGQQADPCWPSSTPHVSDEASELTRIEVLCERQQRGLLPTNDWLDTLLHRTVDQMYAAQLQDSDDLILTIEMPAWDLPVVFGEPEPKCVPWHPSTRPTPDAHVDRPWISPSLFTIHDPDAFSENLVEAKHRRLVRSQRLDSLDRERKPTAAVRDELHAILLYPPTRVLTSAEMDLIWSFRFYLTRYSSALTKFVKSVVWSDAQEARQATDVLLPMWAEPQLADALELLGPTFQHLKVRAYAVKQLHRASDEQLQLYLLQLVQALKFDEEAFHAADEEQRAVYHAPFHEETPRLVDLLCARSVRHAALGTMFFWYVTVECADARYGALFERVHEQLLALLARENAPLLEMLERQRHFVDLLTGKAAELRTSRDTRPGKIDKLRAWLADRKTGLRSFPEPLSLPLDPDVSVVGVVAENSTVFKSNLFPLRIECRGESDPYTVIVKNGDDMRQDQLVLQLFTLMDRLLRDENLDLKITPYHVLATSPIDGLVQYIPSMSVAAAVAEYGDLLSYMRSHYCDPENTATFHVQASVLDTFVRSCSGYCVITYLLGVGDRHLDNLLIAPDGHFFHVDFGYILGRDPKPFPPPVKVCKEMVDAMGGASSMYYMRFKKLCHTAFACLRKNANLILNLVALMVEADIPDIRAEPDKAVLKIQDKFMLTVGEERAVQQFEALLNETSYISTMFDRLHNMAQYFRQ